MEFFSLLCLCDCFEGHLPFILKQVFCLCQWLEFLQMIVVFFYLLMPIVEGVVCGFISSFAGFVAEVLYVWVS